MSTVIMRHPTLPTDQEIEVPRDAMPHYSGAGWQLVPAEELEKRAAEQAKAKAEARAAEEKAMRKAETVETASVPDESEPAESTERPARSRRAHDKKTEEN